MSPTIIETDPISVSSALLSKGRQELVGRNMGENHFIVDDNLENGNDDLSATEFGAKVVFRHRVQ